MANTANLALLSVEELNALIPTPNNTISTDFSVSPYWDDYDRSKQFYKMLWRPGYAIQGRELNQAHTYTQKQISRFGQHVFREGSIVLPGQFSIENDVDYVKVKDTNASNNTITISNYLNETLTGNTNGIKAYVIETVDGSESSANTKTLYVRYQSSAISNSAIKTFQAGEILSSNAGTVVVGSSSPIGKGSRFVIREGVFYGKEHFVWFPTQSIIISRYTTTPSCRVGFLVQEDIVRFTQDRSLLDPALESSNYAAPGADRFRLTPTLTTLDIEDTTGAPDFVELFTIKDGIVTELYERSQYNILKDELAKRTLDESGDYYVKGLSVRVRENFDNGTNGGYSANGNTSLLSVGVEPGIAYVKGYEVTKLVTDYVTTEKSNTFSNVSSQIATATQGSYIPINEFTGGFTADQGNIIFLRDRLNKRLSNNLWGSGSAVGNTIGTARVRIIEYNAGTLGTPNGVVSVYLTDIRMNGTNSFANVRAISATNFGGDVVLEGNSAVLKETTNDVLLYYVGQNGIRNIRDTDGNPQMSFNFKRTTSGVSITSGTLSISVSVPGESFPYGSTTLSDADKRDIVLTLDSDVTIAGSGTATKSGNFTVIGSATSFTQLNVGDKIQFSNNTKPYFIASIANNSYLDVTETLPSTLSGNTYSKVYKNGDLLDLTTKGFTAGTVRSVTANTNSITINLQENVTGITGTVTYQLNRSGAQEAQKLLRANCHVLINVANATTSTSGPYNLGFPDVYRINKIVKKTSSFPAGTDDGTDVTSSFIFDNGQRDTYYEHATITPKAALANTDRLLVNFDFFEPVFSTGRGYFSIDSYPINDTVSFNSNTNIRTETIPIYTSPTHKLQYDLRNYLDFRPVKTNTASYVTSSSGASANPSLSGTFKYDTNGLRLPVPATQFSFDYSYFLARIDLVVMDTEGVISIIRGVPSANPITPVTPPNVMPLASLYITPYPSLAPNYAQSINRKDLSTIVRKMTNIRFTMRDIGVLKQRIDNLEYYQSLSLLQRDAIDMAILDADGLNRFKNGIFVDPFNDHTFGDTLNPDYRIVVDRDEKSIRPIYTMHSIPYEYISADSSGVTKTGDLITLPYTHEVLLDQPAVTSFRNVELSSYRFVGTIEMQPAIDTWIDTETLADNQVTLGPSANNLPQGVVTEWNEWQTISAGYTWDRSASFKGSSFSGGSSSRIPSNLISSPNSLRDQRVTGTITQERTGTETSYIVNEDVISLGDRVVNVGIQPYIRPQTIDLKGRGLKANTQVYVFFDGEDMSDYAAPLTETQYNQTPGQRTSSGFTPTEGGNLVTNQNGDVWIALRLPATGKRFRVGQKEVIITDSPTNSTDASTYAKNYFVAQGLIQQKQESILTTREIISQVTPVRETTTQTRVVGYIDNPSCSAYTLLAKAPEGEEGLFLTKVDLYFARKHPTLGVWVEIRAMDTAGGITRTQVPFSEVWVDADDIVLSDDGYTNPTTINFPAPVFLYNNTQYAFIIHTVGLNPDTYIWISRLGETDTRTGKKVNSRPLTGTFYTTNNNLNWNIVDDIDLRITFYRAKFTVGSGTAVVGNIPVEKFLVSNVSSELTVGETFTSNLKLTLSGNTGSIIVGDYLVGANSGANSTVISFGSGIAEVANTRYINGERVTIRYGSNAASKGLTSLITDAYSGTAILSKYHVYQGNTTAEFIKSNGYFTVADTIRGISSNSKASISSIQKYRYSTVDFEPTYLSFKKTDISFEMQPTSNTLTTGSYRQIIENKNYFFDTEQALASRSIERNDLGGLNSNKVRVTLSTSTEYLSPVFDVGRAHSIFVDNIINSNTTYGLETNAFGGELINKYISEVVELAEGQDAEDMIVLLTAYRPPGTDVKIWIKILHAEDSDTFSNRTWIELEKYQDGVYSSLSDRNDFKEISYKIPSSYLTGPVTVNSPGGEVQYVNSQGITFTGYKYFQIKIGLAADNSAVVPRAADVRAICLQI